MADFFNTQLFADEPGHFYGRPMLGVRSTRGRELAGLVRSCRLLWRPACIICDTARLPRDGFGYKVSSPGPVLFAARASGLNGRPFTMLNSEAWSPTLSSGSRKLAALNENVRTGVQLTEGSARYAGRPVDPAV